MDNEKNELMLAHVEKWRHCGKTIREYSESIGVSKGKFEYWVKKVRVANSAKNKFPGFIEISRSDKNLNCGQAQIPPLPDPQILLTFPSGLILKIYT
jgi:hypothetical protein